MRVALRALRRALTYRLKDYVPVHPKIAETFSSGLSYDRLRRNYSTLLGFDEDEPFPIATPAVKVNAVPMIFMPSVIQTRSTNPPITKRRQSSASKVTDRMIEAAWPLSSVPYSIPHLQKRKTWCGAPSGMKVGPLAEYLSGTRELPTGALIFTGGLLSGWLSCTHLSHENVSHYIQRDHRLPRKITRVQILNDGPRLAQSMSSIGKFHA